MVTAKKADNNLNFESFLIFIYTKWQKKDPHDFIVGVLNVLNTN